MLLRPFAAYNQRMLKIQKRALLSALQGAREMHPDEFIALFRGEEIQVQTGKRPGKGAANPNEREPNDTPDLLLTELILPPLAQGDEESSSFNPYFIPANSSEKASFHSHPDPDTAYPSDTDLHYFDREGGVHFIACYPFRIQDTNCFDASGRKVNFKIV